MVSVPTQPLLAVSAFRVASASRTWSLRPRAGSTSGLLRISPATERAQVLQRFLLQLCGEFLPQTVPAHSRLVLEPRQLLRSLPPISHKVSRDWLRRPLRMIGAAWSGEDPSATNRWVLLASASSAARAGAMLVVQSVDFAPVHSPSVALRPVRVSIVPVHQATRLEICSLVPLRGARTSRSRHCTPSVSQQYECFRRSNPESPIKALRHSHSCYPVAACQACGSNASSSGVPATALK